MSQHTPQARWRAKQDAERARVKAFWLNAIHTLRGVPNELLPFEAVRSFNASAESYSGVRAIEIAKIVGSVDRYQDFDHYFLPRLNFPLDRWIGIRQARIEGVELPAIAVYQVGEVYFVKDGHHRVSVARSEGQHYIDAEIIVLNVPIAPDRHDSIKDLIIKGEYSRFLEVSGLGRLRPGHRAPLFTVPGRYDLLLDHIATRKYYLGEAQGREAGWDEAVTSWYDELYLPLVEDVERFRVLARFPGRTDADLYLWIMDHRYYLAEHLGQDVGSAQATRDYAQRFSPPVGRRMLQQLRRLWRGRAA